MLVTEKISITKVLSNEDFKIAINGKEIIVGSDSDDYEELAQIYKRLYATSKTARKEELENIKQTCSSTIKEYFTDTEEGTGIENLSNEDRLLKGIDNICKFFTEFDFCPSYRFINTVSNLLKRGEKPTIDYVLGYFNLLDSPYKNEIVSKVKCKEFKSILEDLSVIKTNKTINSRLKIYYGSAGCGKTTLAQKESNGNCIICNNSMQPSDLMKDFDFKEGNPTFKKSALRKAMEEGKTIVLDEINLLPYDSLRFLQGLLDGKSEFTFEGSTIQIAEGFNVIGTMNLIVNGNVFGLPEPLVDRCQEIREFKLNAKMLMNAII